MFVEDQVLGARSISFCFGAVISVFGIFSVTEWKVIMIPASFSEKKHKLIHHSTKKIKSSIMNFFSVRISNPWHIKAI